jgi:hypothetical protein
LVSDGYRAQGMSENEAAEFARILRRNAVDFIFVGGTAIRAHFPSETLDFDVMVLPEHFAEAVERIDHDPSVASMDRTPASMPGGHVIVKGTLVRFDLLDPAAYSGTKTGTQFYSYVRRYASEKSDLGRVAIPAVVWYMRLVIDRFELYIPKILRDLRAGAPWTTIEGVRAIGARFGVGNRINPRIDLLAETVRVARLR